MINLITAVTTYKNKLAIGRKGDLLFKLKKDMAFFKQITEFSLNKNSLLDRNIVLMGRKTYFSIPQKYRPLSNRINLVLTRDPELIKISPIPKNLNLTKNLYYTDLKTFYKLYKKYNPNVFVIGGSELYNLFMEKADKLYITYVQDLEGKQVKFATGQEPDTFINHFSSNYKLIGYSEKYIDREQNGGLSYRILYYNKSDKVSDEYNYLDLMQKILNNGNTRDDRTGTGTISTFGTQMRFDISQSIPLLTTKRVPFKTMVEELLWFCRGDTDAKILQKKSIKIWDGNTSREFLDNRGLHHYDEGILGPGYGFQIRFQGAKYSQNFADTSKCDTSLIGGFDQLAYIENLLKTDPFSRRIMMCYWNPSDFDKTALLPCHYSIQFYVTEEKGERYLSSHFIMRSNDVFLGNPVNISSYSVLTYILALKCNMKPKELVYSCSDTHIYRNHITQVKEQLTRTCMPFPKLKLDDSIKNKDWPDITINDFDLIGYFSHPSIKAPMAI
jgi:thymidylate synthase